MLKISKSHCPLEYGRPRCINMPHFIEIGNSLRRYRKKIKIGLHLIHSRWSFRANGLNVTHSPWSPPLMGFHQIWHRATNVILHLWQILGDRLRKLIMWGSKIVIFHWQSQSRLTQAGAPRYAENWTNRQTDRQTCWSQYYALLTSVRSKMSTLLRYN